MPFLSGLAAGMIVSSIGGAIALAIDAKKKGQTEVLAPATHYHITLDEDSTLPEFMQEKKKAIIKPSPSLKVKDDFIAKVLDAPPVDRDIDWKASFEKAMPVKKGESKNVRDEKGEQAVEVQRPSDSKDNKHPVSPSRARAQKRERQDRKNGK